MYNGGLLARFDGFDVTNSFSYTSYTLSVVEVASFAKSLYVKRSFWLLLIEQAVAVPALLLVILVAASGVLALLLVFGRTNRRGNHPFITRSILRGKLSRWLT